MSYIERADYSLEYILENEKYCIESLENDYDGYIGDAIAECADNFSPIHYSDIWDNARKISSYAEEAMGNGLCEGVTELAKILQAGYYEFYSQLLYSNLEAIIHNIMIKKVNAFLDQLSIESLDKVDIDEIETLIDEATETIDGSDTFSDVEDKADEIIDQIKELLDEE